jgi:hypothetical protein
MASASPSSSKNDNDMVRILKSLKSAHTHNLIKKPQNHQQNRNHHNHHHQNARAASILDITECSSQLSLAIGGGNCALSSTSSSSSTSSLLDHNNNNIDTNNKLNKNNQFSVKNEKLNKISNKLPVHPFLANKNTANNNENKLKQLKSENKNNNNHYYGTSKCGGGGGGGVSSKNCCPDLESEHKNYDSSSEAAVRRKFKRVNKIFYNGFLNNQKHQEKHQNHHDSPHDSSGLPEYQAHASELLHFLKSLWVTNTMCDLSIVIDNKKYPAHRVSLAMFSKKYRNEFQKQLQTNKNTGIYTICLKCTTSFALESILKYIYTAKIDINPANVEEILAGARELGIDDLICMATDYLSSLSIGDVLDYMGNMLNKDGAELMVYELYAYMMTHLEKISRTPEYFKVRDNCLFLYENLFLGS